MSIKHIFVDRGDPSAWDFEEGVLTTDDTWRDLDLSSIVPAGATQVLIGGYIADDVLGTYFQLRENGNSDGYNAFTLTTQVANVGIEINALVSLDSNRVIEYLGKTVAFVIKIVVRGWYIPLVETKLVDVTENTSPVKEDLLYTVADPSGTPVDRRATLGNAMKLAPHWVDREITDWDLEYGDLTVDSAWHDFDISSIVPANASRVQVKTQINPNGTAWRAFSLRIKNDNYTSWQYYTTFWADSSFQMEFPCFNNRTLEYKLNDTVATFNIVVTAWYVDSINYSTTTTTTTTTTTV